MFRRLLLFGFGAFLSLFFLAYLSPENKLKNTFYAYLNYFDSDKRIIGQLLLSKEFNYLVSNEEDINLFLKDCWVNHDLSDKESYPQQFVLENIMPERLEASIYYCLDSLTANKVSLMIQQIEDSSILNINSYHKKMLDSINADRIEAIIYYCKDTLISKKIINIYDTLNNSTFSYIDTFKNEILNIFNNKSLTIKHSKFLVGENKYIDYINPSVKSLQEIRDLDGKSILIDVRNYLTKDSLEIEYGKFTRGDNQYIDNISWKEGSFESVKLNNGGYVLIQVHNVFKEQSWRVHSLFYDNEIIKEQGEDRIKTITNFIKIEKGVSLSSKSYKSSYVVVALVLSIMFIVIYFIRKNIIRKI